MALSSTASIDFPPSGLAAFRVQPPETTSTYSRSVLGARRNLATTRRTTTGSGGKNGRNKREKRVAATARGSKTPDVSRLEVGALRRAQTARGPVVESANSARTQNGHIRNDTRDVSRRISGVAFRPICRKNCVASDRACTRVTPQNFHGKEGVDGSSPLEGLPKVPVNRHFVVVCFKNTRTHSGHIFGTRDAQRRLASSSDTPLTRPVDKSIRKSPS